SATSPTSEHLPRETGWLFWKSCPVFLLSPRALGRRRSGRRARRAHAQSRSSFGMLAQLENDLLNPCTPCSKRDRRPSIPRSCLALHPPTPESPLRGAHTPKISTVLVTSSFVGGTPYENTKTLRRSWAGIRSWHDGCTCSHTKGRSR